jgi:hypothetical protein
MQSQKTMSRRTVMVAGLIASSMIVGCAGGSTQPTQARVADAGSTKLRGVCPDPVVIQTGWFPQVERGAAYRLVGPGYEIDKAKKLVIGPLVTEGKDTGVRVEVRSGGPAIGFQQTSAQLYLDRSILLADVPTDEAVQNSAEQPTLAVVAPLEIDPLALFWDPETYPQFNTVTDIGQTDVRVLYFEGSTYMEYLVGSGVLRRSQVDGSYDGSPSRFVAENGKIVQAGFVTNEPLLLEHEIKQWGKPVQHQLLYDTGYPIYPRTTLAIRAGEKAKLAPCLAKLVPMIQKAQVNFMAEPAPTVDLILELVDAYGRGFVYSRGLAEHGVTTMRELGLVSNGPGEVLGDFDFDRVQQVLDIVLPIFTAQNKPLRPGLRPEDLATNDFIDPQIGLPAGQ